MIGRAGGPGGSGNLRRNVEVERCLYLQSATTPTLISDRSLTQGKPSSRDILRAQKCVQAAGGSMRKRLSSASCRLNNSTILLEDGGVDGGLGSAVLGRIATWIA